MPLNVRRFNSSVFLVFLTFAGAASAQTVPPATVAVSAPQPAPTSGDVMRDRISKSKAYIAVRNYNAAIYELENIRRETGDTSVQGVVNVLLMNSYLEQGDFKRAQDLLTEFYNQQKTTKPNALAAYMAVAGQVVKGARSRAERYRALGLNITDRTLPLEALNDLEKMRETVELVITQSKEMGAEKAKSGDAMAMLEEASNSRAMLARDDYDSRRWKDEVSDTREKMVSSTSVVLSAVDGIPTTPVNQPTTSAPANTQQPVYQPSSPVNTQQPVYQPTAPAGQTPVMQPVVDNRTAASATREREIKTAVPSETTVAKKDEPVYVQSAPPTVKPDTAKEQPVSQVPGAKTEAPKTEPVKAGPAEDLTRPAIDPNSPVDVGSLLSYATKQSPPIYPAAAKSIRATGVVKVEVTVDENGDVTSVQKTSGPPLLQGAARDAVKKWKFKPFVRDGQPVKATGFISFNFSL